jgi:hypothetical protein
MVDDDPIKVLFKLGPREYMDQLLHEGLVYMNTLDYFARRDPGEGTAFWVSARSTIDIEDHGDWRRLGVIRDPVRVSSDYLGNANLYCLHAMTSNDIGTTFKLSELGFGDTFVLIVDSTEFFQRLSVAAGNHGQELICRMVRYVDKRSYVGPMGPFSKFAEYAAARAADRELRALAIPGLGGPLTLRLGDLSDIAVIGDADKRMRLTALEGGGTV